MRILGIDYGTKKIGLAFGDSDVGVAVPLDVVPNAGQQTIDVFAKKIQVDDIDAIVVGVPLSQGEHHSSAQLDRTRAFIEALKQVVHVPIHEVDEAYTTVESIRLQKEEGSEAGEDALAAMLVVQAFIDNL